MIYENLVRGAVVSAFLCLPFSAIGGDNHGGTPGNSPSAAAAAASVSNSVGIGAGGSGGAGGAGGVGQSGSVTQESKSYGLGMAGLAASANSCQGSVSVAVVGFTYTVEFCRALQEVAVMRALGFSDASVLNRLCQLPSISEVAAECVGRVVKRD